MNDHPVITIRANDPDYPVITWTADGTQDVLDALEEALYVWWELEHESFHWKRELYRNGHTTFLYANVEPATITRISEYEFVVEM